MDEDEGKASENWIMDDYLERLIVFSNKAANNMESFFHNFKAKRIHNKAYRSEGGLRWVIIEYMALYKSRQGKGYVIYDRAKREN